MVKFGKYLLALCLILKVLFLVTMAEAVSIKPTGVPQTLYSWARQRCVDADIPDAPARAFRRADGKIAIFAAHAKNWELVGPDIFGAKPTCHSVLADVRGQNGDIWIEGIFTQNGKDIAAVASRDHTVFNKAHGCKAGKPGQCWTNDLLGLVSHDMGETFNFMQLPTESIATYGVPYPADAEGRFGFFTASNLVRLKGQIYFLAWMQGKSTNDAGNCVFRNSDPINNKNWQAWDGKEFTNIITNCKPIATAELPTEVRSVSFIPDKDMWIAVYPGRFKLSGDQTAIPGFYFSTSKDFFAWSGPYRIMEAATKPRETQNDFFVSYPSMIDPKSKSNIFDTIDNKRAIIMFTLQHLDSKGQGTMNRDLNYVEVEIF